MISQMYRESARIHAADSGNAVCLEIFFERLIGAKIGRLRIITDYQTGKKQSARLHVFAVHSVIADFGNGQSDELSGVGRIGKDLLIAAHTRIEYDLTASFNGRAKGDSVDYRPVLQREERAVQQRIDRLRGTPLRARRRLFAGPAASESAAAHRPTLTLRLSREAKGAVSDGQGEILYEASVSDIKGSSWQTAVFDISAFTELLDASDEVTLTLLMDDPSADSGVTAYGMGIAAVHVTGNTAASGNNTVLVTVILVILALMVIGGFVFLLLRHRKRRH